MARPWGCIENLSPCPLPNTELGNVVEVQARPIKEGKWERGPGFLLLIFWFFPSGKVLICFRNIKEQGLNVFWTR